MSTPKENDLTKKEDAQLVSCSSSDDEKEQWTEYCGEYPCYIGIGSWASQSKSSDDEFPVNILNNFEAGMLVCLLEDTLDELVILKPIDMELFDWQLRRKLTPTRIFPEVDSKPDLTPAIKLQRDREQIETIIRKLIKYLAEDGCFSPLISAVHDLQKQQEDDVQLVAELKRNLVYLKELNAAVREKRRLDDLEEKGRDEFMYQLQDEMDDMILKCNVEERFVNKWENVRNSQNQLRLKMVENVYKDNISKLTSKMKMEKRVTHEFQLYLKANQSELEEQLEEWMSLYDTEMERRENKIINLKYNRDQAEENKKNLLQLYETRKMEMRDWVRFRDLRKKRAAASLIIQCWWRGIMARKKLGPYKQKKPKGEDGKK
ncbi:hypothetical protein RUM44_007717 [Polyplax serrata]|uniref:Dynein regulatory complex protein 9 n=1 Tax=Polyplax serrata TaxID=468196 RepID=A0ABR1B769_POLSC